MDNIKIQLQTMYHGKGMSITDIAKKLNMSYGTVRRYFDLVGIETKRKKRKTREQIIADRKSKEEILRLLKNNDFSTMKVSKILEVNYNELKIWMEYYNIPQKFSRGKKGDKMSNEEFVNKFEKWTDFNLNELK